MSEPPPLDVTAQVAWLAGIADPVERIKGADALHADALQLVAEVSGLRRAAIAEAYVAGCEIPLSQQSVRAAIRPDREFLQGALTRLLRDGVTTTSSQFLAQGLGLRAPLESMAVRVVAGVQHLNSPAVNADDHEYLMAAVQRARRLVPGAIREDDE
jgi:hypothetical protein